MAKRKSLAEIIGGKKHQVTRVETIIKECWNCPCILVDGKLVYQKTVHVYLGNHGTQKQPSHKYRCKKCGVDYDTSKKIRGDKGNGKA